MNLNAKMHPRNVFRTPPCFKMLALKYPTFKQHVKLTAAGQATIDFKDSNAVRELSKVLLREYFDLQVIIPPNSLTPTIPLRLNYVLWLQDLAAFMAVPNKEIRVIDIGAGASCIYGLLMAKLTGWKVLALEKCEENYNFAVQNVAINNLQDSICCKNVDFANLELLIPELEADTRYTFCMSNPPFFEESCDSSNIAKREPPKNGPSGRNGELSCPGGEVEFIGRLIKQSIQLKDKIRVFTTMVGVKRNLSLLRKALKTAQTFSFIQTEFCQGVTKRWALAWTFESIDLRKTLPHGVTPHLENKEKKEKTLTYFANHCDSVENLTTEISQVLKTLKAKFDIKYKSTALAEIEVCAYQDTWSHARRRRRNIQRMLAIDNIILAGLQDCQQFLALDYRLQFQQIANNTYINDEVSELVNNTMYLRILRKYNFLRHMKRKFLRAANSAEYSLRSIKRKYADHLKIVPELQKCVESTESKVVSKTEEFLRRTTVLFTQIDENIKIICSRAARNNIILTTDLNDHLEKVKVAFKRKQTTNEDVTEDGPKRIKLDEKESVKDEQVQLMDTDDHSSQNEMKNLASSEPNPTRKRKRKRSKPSKRSPSRLTSESSTPGELNMQFCDDYAVSNRAAVSKRIYDSDSQVDYINPFDATVRPLIRFSILLRRVEDVGVNLTFSRTVASDDVNILCQIMTYITKQFK